MRRTGISCILAALSAVCAVFGAHAEEAAGEPAGRVYAVIVAGLPGTPVHARRYADWAGRFRDHLVRGLAVPEADVLTLAANPAEGEGGAARVSTAVEVRAALTALAAKATARDQVVLIVLAHGSSVDGTVKVVLPGPDMAAAEFGALMTAIPARNQVAILHFAGSGDVIGDVAAPGRVTLAATAPGEVAEPVFAEFLLMALENARADGFAAPAGGQADGTVTVLEAYNFASRETPMWMRRMRREGEGDSWVVTGQEAVRLFEKLCAAPAGTLGGRGLSAASQRDIPDPDMPLVTPRDRAESFGLIRMVTEHAVLEDNGMEVGVRAISGGVHRPVTGVVAGEPGSLARRVVIGRADLLPAEAGGPGGTAGE